MCDTVKSKSCNGDLCNGYGYLAAHEWPGESTAVPWHNYFDFPERGQHCSTTWHCSCWPGEADGFRNMTIRWSCALRNDQSLSICRWRWALCYTRKSDLISEGGDRCFPTVEKRPVHTGRVGQGALAALPYLQGRGEESVLRLPVPVPVEGFHRMCG